ncbi:MAG: hypothetical protein ABI647_19645 [Gemmatimonadota bacterium]
MEIGAGTRVFAVLGDPVAHSMSPMMQNAAMRTLGLDAAYVAFRCPAGRLAEVVNVLARSGGGGNATIPHKEALAGLVETIGPTPLASCNTFWGDGERILGAETDSAGIRAAWERLGAPEGPWLIAGTGGSALAAVRAANAVGVAVAVRSRSAARAAGLRRQAETLGVASVEPEAAAVAINCTPLGLAADDPLPLDPAAFPGLRAALDLVYRRGATEWVRVCRGRGLPAADGREVLVGQGAAAFECWFPGVKAPVEVMRAAVERGLR